MDPDRRDAGLRGARGVQAGDGNVQFNFFAGAVRGRLRPDAYLEQVRRIAPPELRDRSGELAELARFCLEPDGPPYVWWRAGPWAGKSALLSTFVLRPPAEVARRVRIVSFFITARLAAQDTREAFTQVLLEQLAGLTGQVLPAVLPEATREGYLLDLLAQAAVACQAAGGRLVLVVDGLDEDRGVTAGPGAHSIAALLPASPPAGMRVIVTGRPDPPIPDDVPGWHPLRGPAIIRPLAASPHARDMQRLGRQELRRLLGGPVAGRDLLGFLAAARGGLSGPDLEELTGVPLWGVEEILHAAAGRTFTCRASRWAADAGPEVYLLGHEELQAAASRYLASRLPGYYDRLHGWADSYQDRGWPPGTPEYLLSGYYALLTDLSDLPRMTACAINASRHDRMLDITGGDAAALAEIRAALDLIVGQDAPDLASALALACYRDQLTDRNTHIPVGLPAVWATLGQTTRAEALATSIAHPFRVSIPDPFRQAQALARVAAALARAGQHHQAAGITVKAETTACSITDPSDRAQALAQVARILAGAGQRQQAATIAGQAEAAARTIPSQLGQVLALAEVAGALADAGQHQLAATTAGQAEMAACSITSPGEQAQVAGALARAGQHRQAETLASAISDPYQQATALAEVAGALARVGQDQQAARVAGRAETAARFLTDPVLQEQALGHVAGALAETGQHQRAEALARSITDPYLQATALARVAGALAETGQHQRAEALARSITEPIQQAQALADVAGALAGAGQDQQAARIAGQAETAARSIIGDPYFQASALVEAAEALARAGQDQQAARIAGQAETAARAITHRYHRAQVPARAAGVLARAGQYQRAEALARSITEPVYQAEALARVAGVLAGAGQDQQAARIAGQAEMIARADPDRPEEALARIAGVLAGAGQDQQAARIAGQAEMIARAVTDPFRQAEALAQVAGVLAGAGQYQQAARIARQAETTARSITNPEWQAQAQAAVAFALADAGQYQQAEALARSITVTYRQAVALARVAGALADAGQYQQAEALARSITEPITAPTWQATGLGSVARALAGAGQYQQAETVARSITSLDYRASALAAVVGALAKAGETRAASRVAAEICAIGSWRTAAGPVLLLDPSAFKVLARVLDE